MRYLAYAIIPIIISVLFACINKEVREKERNMSENYFVIRKSKIIIWTGIICSLLFGTIIVLMTAFPNDTVTWDVYLGFSVFVFLGLLLVIYCVFWKLEIDGNQIAFRSLFRKQNKFSFDMITKVKIKTHQMLEVYSRERKLFTVESTCVGYHIFLSRLNKENITIQY